MPEPSSIRPEALRVLRVLRERSSDGYSLLSKTGLAEKDLYDVIVELGGMVAFTGDPRPGKIGEAYFSLQPSAYGYADMLIGTQYKRAF